MRGLQFLLAAQLVNLVSETGVARAADSTREASTSLPETLKRIAPAVVKVRRGDWWGTGFVFGARRTLITSYELVNGPGDLQVVASDGKTRSARVVAWSADDDLALLELDTELPAQPLRPARVAPFAGMELVVLYQPRNPELSEEESGGWSVPIPRFTRVGRIAPKELDIDLSLLDLLGDDGAVVVTPQGEVVGVISRRTVLERRVIVTRVDRIEAVLPKRSRQGTFSPAGRSSWFGGVFVTPLATTFSQNDEERTVLVGLGGDFGYRFNWLFTSATWSFFQSDHRQVKAQETESFDRLQLELKAGVQFTLTRNIQIFLGPGVAFGGEFVEKTSVDATGSLLTAQTTRGHARPQVAFGAVAGSLFVRDVFTISSSPEGRVDIGVVFGR